MRVLIRNLVYHYGDSFDDAIVKWSDEATGLPVNLTGYTAKLQARHPTTGALVLELTSGGGGITIDALAGTLTFDATPAMMTQAPSALVQGQSYKYDLQVQTGAAIKTLVKGDFWVDPQITT